MKIILLIGATALFFGASVSASDFWSDEHHRPNSTTTARPDNSTTAPSSRNRCHGMPDDTLFPSRDSCNNFVTCRGEVELELECRPEGTKYDHERQACDHPHLVNCYEHNRCSEEEDDRIIPSENCANFYICRHGDKSQEVTCRPEGTLFDSIRGVCDHPAHVTCWGTEGKNLCAGKPDGALVPSANCSNYFKCHNQQPTDETTCVPEGTQFDFVREICNFPEQVECWTPEHGGGGGGNVTTPAPGTTVGPTRPPRPDEIPHDFCRGIVMDFLPHPNEMECTQFVVCVLGQPTIEHCPPDYIFYPQVGVCGYGNTETCDIDVRWLEEYLREHGYDPMQMV